MACALVAAAAPRASHACSPPPGRPGVRATGELVFVGRATSDTLRAGVGPVRPTNGMGELIGSPDTLAIFGQVIRAERVPGDASATLRAALRRHDQRVVLIEWPVGSRCEPMARAGHGRWVADTGRALYHARLRDPRDWVGGVPTADVIPAYLGYYIGAADAMLTADELFELESILPTEEVLTARLDTALVPVEAWVHAHPALASRPPVVSIMESLVGYLAYERERRRPVPLAGTYRVTARLGAHDSTVYYVRTEDHPDSFTGYYAFGRAMWVRACAAASERALPARRPAAGCTSVVAFGDSVGADSAGRRARGGYFAAEAPDSAFRTRFARERPTFRAWEQQPRGGAAGVFTEAEDGAVAYTFALGPAGAPLYEVDAVRVSAVVVRRELPAR